LIVVELKGEPKGRLQPQPRIVTRRRDGRQVAILHQASKTRRYQKSLAWAARAAMGRRALITGAVAVTVTAVMSVPRSWSKRKRDAALAGVLRPTGKPDWDNLGKQLDAFKGIVWGDDAPVVDGRVVKVYGEEPMLRIEVKEIGAFDEQSEQTDAAV
jgi:Holliday junction resolvase RusA-like endonuclease